MVAFDYKCPFLQVGYNRNDHFRYFLGVRVRLKKVSFKANEGNKFWDFCYCPLKRGCLLNTGFTVSSLTIHNFHLIVFITSTFPRHKLGQISNFRKVPELLRLVPTVKISSKANGIKLSLLSITYRGSRLRVKKILL